MALGVLVPARGRQAAIERLLTWPDGDLGAALGCVPARMPALLWPFLILRILGVIPGTSLNREDTLLMLAKVAEVSDPGIWTFLDEAS
jgi:hypothetical protein